MKPRLTAFILCGVLVFTADPGLFGKSILRLLNSAALSATEGTTT